MTRKYQATIPMAVREKLDLRQGDAVAFEIRATEVVLRKEAPLGHYLQSLEETLQEWNGENDDEAYRGL